MKKKNKIRYLFDPTVDIDWYYKIEKMDKKEIWILFSILNGYTYFLFFLTVMNFYSVDLFAFSIFILLVSIITIILIFRRKKIVFSIKYILGNYFLLGIKDLDRKCFNCKSKILFTEFVDFNKVLKNKKKILKFINRNAEIYCFNCLKIKNNKKIIKNKI